MILDFHPYLWISIFFSTLLLWNFILFFCGFPRFLCGFLVRVSSATEEFLWIWRQWSRKYNTRKRGGDFFVKFPLSSLSLHFLHTRADLSPFLLLGNLIYITLQIGREGTGVRNRAMRPRKSKKIFFSNSQIWC